MEIGASGGWTRPVDRTFASPRRRQFPCPSPARGVWNTYVVEWTAQSIKIIYNGQVCLTETLAASTFNKDYVVALTQGLGWPGNDFQPGITPLPAQTLVDYVRVYK